MSSVDPSLQRHEPSAPEVPIYPPADDFHPALEARVLAITRRCFPGPMEVEASHNPEEPEHRWRVVVVHARPTSEETDAATVDWHQQMIQELGPDQFLRYTILVQFPEA
jgi:hypothetical protein